MPIAGSIESKIANWPAVRPPIMIARHGAADAARQKALEVVVRRVEGIVVNRALDGHFCLRAFVLSEFLSLQLGDFGLERS